MGYTFLSENTRALDANYGALIRQAVVNLNILEEFLGLELTTLKALRVGQPPPIFSFQTDNGHDFKDRIDTVRSGIGFDAFDWGTINLTAGNQFMSATDINAIARAVGCPMARDAGYYLARSPLLENHTGTIQSATQAVTPATVDVEGTQRLYTITRTATLSGVATEDPIIIDDWVIFNPAIKNPFGDTKWYSYLGFGLESHFMIGSSAAGAGLKRNNTPTPGGGYDSATGYSGILFDPYGAFTAITLRDLGGRVVDGQSIDSIPTLNRMIPNMVGGGDTRLESVSFKFDAEIGSIKDEIYNPQICLFGVNASKNMASIQDVIYSWTTRDAGASPANTIDISVSETEISSLEIEAYISTGDSEGTIIGSTDSDGDIKLVGDYEEIAAEIYGGLRIKNTDSFWNPIADLNFNGVDSVLTYNQSASAPQFGAETNNGEFLKRRQVYAQWEFNGLPICWVAARL